MEFEKGSNLGQNNRFNENSLGDGSQNIPGDIQNLTIINSPQSSSVTPNAPLGQRTLAANGAQELSSVNCQLHITHDAVGVPTMMLQAHRHIVLHAAYYPKYGMDQQGMTLWRAMKHNPLLHLTAIFTDISDAAWAEEFARIMRPFYTADEFQEDLNYSRHHFERLLREFGSDRVSIIDSPRLPLFPVILIDDTLIVGHYAHSDVITPEGLWFTIHHPKILLMYESLLAGGSPLCVPPEERALIRYLDELIVKTGENKSEASVPEFKKSDSLPVNVSAPRRRAQIRCEILEYVNRVTPLLSFDWKHRFMMVWESILDLPEVESRIYDVGRQRYTSFNRTLVASILRFLDKYGAYALAFSGSVMARCLEKDISHPVRAGFRNDPPQDIMASIDMMIRSGGYKHRKP